MVEMPRYDCSPPGPVAVVAYEGGGRAEFLVQLLMLSLDMG